MLKISTLDDISALRENFEVECKLAGGRDGKGELPKDFWETYSAFARVMSGAQSSSSGHSEKSSGHKQINSGHSERTQEGWLLVAGLSKPLIDKLEGLTDALYAELLQKASPAREKAKLPKAELEEIILILCERYYLTLPVLCSLLNRQPDPLRKSYLKPLAERSALTLAFPRTPTDPRQAYTSTRGDK